MERPTQTRVKHHILEDYLDTWGGIILNGLRGPYQRSKAEGWDASFQARFVYVDCFAGPGRYEQEGQEVDGSPLIGIRLLDKHKEWADKDKEIVTPQIASILIEEDKGTYKILLNNLNNQGFGERVREGADIASIQDGEIAIINGDYRDYVSSLLSYSGQDDYTWAFYLLDPNGPLGIPLDAVGRIVSQPRHDVMINFQLDVVYRRGKGLAEKGDIPRLRTQRGYINTMYGSAESWQGLAKELDGEDLQRAYAERYRSVLEKQDPELAVKMIPLRFQDVEKVIYYLHLTTHDGTGGLTRNQILDSARISEYDYRQERRRTTGGQLELPGMAAVEEPGRPTVEQADIPEVAGEIRERCQLGEDIPYREVLKRMVNSAYYPEDVEAAMKYLKEKEEADYGTPLRNTTMVRFS